MISPLSYHTRILTYFFFGTTTHKWIEKCAFLFWESEYWNFDLWEFEFWDFDFWEFVFWEFDFWEFEFWEFDFWDFDFSDPLFFVLFHSAFEIALKNWIDSIPE